MSFHLSKLLPAKLIFLPSFPSTEEVLHEDSCIIATCDPPSLSMPPALLSWILLLGGVFCSSLLLVVLGVRKCKERAGGRRDGCDWWTFLCCCLRHRGWERRRRTGRYAAAGANTHGERRSTWGINHERLWEEEENVTVSGYISNCSSTEERENAARSGARKKKPIVKPPHERRHEPRQRIDDGGTGKEQQPSSAERKGPNLQRGGQETTTTATVHAYVDEMRSGQQQQQQQFCDKDRQEEERSWAFANAGDTNPAGCLMNQKWLGSNTPPPFPKEGKEEEETTHGGER